MLQNLKLIWRRYHYVTWNSDMLTTRFNLAVGALIWAVLLSFPGDIMNAGRGTYRLMAEIASEFVWMLAFGGYGLTMLATLLADIRNIYIRTVESIVGCILWSSSTIACFAAHYKSGEQYLPPAAMSAEVALMGASFWLLVRTIHASRNYSSVRP